MKFFLEILDSNESLLVYFPIRKELEKWPRLVIINMLATLMHPHLEKHVNDKIEERNRYMAESQNTMISVAPEIDAAF